MLFLSFFYFTLFFLYTFEYINVHCNIIKFLFVGSSNEVCEKTDQVIIQIASYPRRENSNYNNNSQFVDCKLRTGTDLYRNDIYHFVVLSYHYDSIANNANHLREQICV